MSRPVIRLPFFYGWAVVAIAFVTMGVAVNSRTMFSLLFPPILEEMQWGTSTTAAAFSVGFLATALFAPLIGYSIDRFGARHVLPVAATFVAVGLTWTTAVTEPWQLYLCFGLLVVGASVAVSYMGHGAFLPNWFVRRRGLALGIAYSGVGFGAIILFPWLQTLIDGPGWRQACIALALLIVVIVIPLNLLFQRTRPEELNLLADGDGRAEARAAAEKLVVDKEWVAREWTLSMAIRTSRFWWVFGGTGSALFVWYAIQVHQTRYLLLVGFESTQAALALGLVPFCGLVGQLGMGLFSDRAGREWGWTLSCSGFALCYAAFLLMEGEASPWLLYLMIGTQGLLGYGLPILTSAIPAEIFGGKNFGAIFGAISVSAALGPSVGPWLTGWLHDVQGDYRLGFAVGIGMCLFSILCVWMAAPRKIRRVAGQVRS